MRYKIVWLDATLTRQPGFLFPYHLTIGDDGEWKDVEAWNFFEAECDQQAIEYVRANLHTLTACRNVETFSVMSGRRVVFTEEDL